jgi:hypothetical protein
MPRKPVQVPRYKARRLAKQAQRSARLLDMTTLRDDRPVLSAVRTDGSLVDDAAWPAIEIRLLRDFSRRGPIARAAEDLVRSRLTARSQPQRRA